MRNWPSKILALVLALILWYFVVGEERAEVGLTVPLVLVNIPRDLVVVNNVTHGIDIRVNGPRSLVRSLSAEGLSKTLDLSNTRPGSVTFSISAEGIPLPRGVTITRIHPTQVTVVLEKQVRKTVSIRPKLKGRPEKGYEVHSVTVRPEQVEISGPEKALEGIDHLYTLPVEIGGWKEDKKEKTYVDFQNLRLYLTKDIPVEVEVKIKKIQEAQERR